MTAQDVRTLLKAQPFQPFRLVMSSGQSYEIRHPEMVFLKRTLICIGVDVEDGIAADFRLCSLLHVTAIEPISPATSASK